MNMQEFWDELAKDGSWSSHYEGELNLNTYNFFTRREAVSRLLAGNGTFERVLDVGCGTGDYLEVARDHQACYFGIDYAFSMIEQARDQIPGHGEKDLALVGDGAYLPYQDNSFDLVFGMGYIEYFENPDGPIRELKRVLRPGGTLVIQSFKKDMFGFVDRNIVRPLRSLFGRNQSFELPSDWVDKKYSKAEFDALMGKHGFRLQDSVFNNFHVFPGIMRDRYPQRYIRLSEKISKTHPALWRFLAVNYIGKYVLDKKPQYKANSKLKHSEAIAE